MPTSKKSKKYKPKGSKCSKGKIMREGYYRKNTWVSPTCIKAKGLAKITGVKGKKVIGPLIKGDLTKFGYKNVIKLSKKERRGALSKALKQSKPLPLFRKLIALSTLNKRTNEKLSKRFKNDAEWIKKTKQYKNRNL